MPEVRLIDANALIKDIAESIRLADEWEKEAREKEDEHGIKCAIDTRRALFAMISRVKEAPTIEAEPVRRGEWHECWYSDTVCASICTNCGKAATQARMIVGQELMTNVRYPLCPNCGARMEN